MQWPTTLVLSGLWIVLCGQVVSGQCPNAASLDFFEEPCGVGLLKGQSFTLAENSTLDSIQLALCSGTNGELVIREFNGGGSNWDEGNIIGQADQISPSSGVPADCLTSSNGFTHYSAHTFTFSNLALEGGVTYVMHLVQGAAASGCTLSYPGGSAFGSSQNSSEDLVFVLNSCPDEQLIFGCTDSGACNFDVTANSDNLTCQYNDCAGTCGGTLTEDECGVCGGDNSTCAGCTDTNACNFDPSAISDDGSCLTDDCNGDCGGTAYTASCGTCIEGNTGLDISECNVCDNQETQSFYEAPCGLGLLKGQSFKVTENGLLHSVKLAVCSGTANQLVVRSFNGYGAGWDEGPILGEANAILPASGTISDCFTSSNGFDFYTEHTFEFSDLGLAAGTDYILHLEEGAAASGCTIAYPDGVAFGTNSSNPSHDLVFEIFHCPDPSLIFGCTDSDACNFNPSATSEDGSCLSLDCALNCGGSAYLDPDCGCVPSEADAGSCYGCMDNSACNYDATSTLQDNSCLYPDCNGDCGGTAFESDCNECIGGNTNFHSGACIDGCLTATIATDPTGCSPGLLYGQSFTAETTGFLEQVQLKTCCAMDAQLVLRRFTAIDACSGASEADWNQGEILGTSPLIQATCPSLNSCLTSSGLNGYQWVSFSFDNVAIEAGSQYTLELIEGVALASCTADYAGGHAFTAENASVNNDLTMAIFTCASSLSFGCTDNSACNYDANAGQDDGSCLTADCSGDCGGDAILDGDCGCIGGNTGIRTEQCVAGQVQSIMANDSDVCTDLLFGQTFSIPVNGFLSSASFQVDLTQNQTIELQRVGGELDGQIEASASRTGTPDACPTTANGWASFSFPQSPIQGGSQYQFVFTNGSAHASCTPAYTGGSGLSINGQASSDDLSFRFVYRVANSGELAWGCLDSNACNYDPNATVDGGNCAEEDCNGDCAGTAEFIAGCGCTGGNTGVTAESCYGCTNSDACNYSAEASFEDGSCLFTIDCAGECGGSATLSPSCGCIGGSTGIDGANCFALCEGEVDHSTYPSNQTFNTGQAAFSQSGQTFTANLNGFLTGTRVRNNAEPGTPLNFELRATDGTQLNNGTLLASGQQTSWENTPGTGGDVFIEWEVPALVNAGTSYVLILAGSGWTAMRSQSDDLPNGASFNGGDNQAALPDLFIELLFCSDLNGCTAAVACNYNSIVTVDDGSCIYADAGFDCAGNACSNDADNDGICDSVDLDSGNANICMDGDGDGCDDCSSGTYAPNNDGPDSDGDGLCDSGDQCSNPDADNFDDPANLPCRGTCDTAPIFEAIQVGSPNSSPNSVDGLLSLTTDATEILFVPSSEFEPALLVLEGLYGAADYSFDLPSDSLLVATGVYSATIFNSAGCQGVASANQGSTFGQDPIALTVIMGYHIECSSPCGVYDTDTDGICDDEDNCIDKLAPNYNDPANGPCLQD